MNTAMVTGPRSPQFFKPNSTSAQNSDEILSGGIPQRPPRQNRQRSDSTSSPTMSGSQYFQHYQPHPQQPHLPQDQIYTSSHSPRPSPRSNPNAYVYSSQPPPPSPMSFQLPPSAFSSRDDSLRSGSIPYPPNANPNYQTGTIHGSSSSASSFRSPHLSPGSSINGSLHPVPEPISLGESLLDDPDYAAYYSDVGVFSTPQLLPGQYLQPLQTAPANNNPQSSRQQSFPQGDSPLSPSRQGHRSGPVFLPSPHLTPTASPLMNDFSNMSLVDHAYHPNAQSLVQKALIGLGAIIIFNGGAIPIILFHGLPGWLWRSAPVNFFQKNPVVDHYVPLALFISTCQWIFNIIVNYLGGRSSIIRSSQALWLIPLVLIGVFFVSAFAHWALFLCYNQIMQNLPRGHDTFNNGNNSSNNNSSGCDDSGEKGMMGTSNHNDQHLHRRYQRTIHRHSRRKWRAPILGLWAALCILLARIGLVMMAVIEGSFWNMPIGILLAIPETIALLSVEYFFIKTIWILARSSNRNTPGARGMSSGGIGRDGHGGVTEASRSGKGHGDGGAKGAKSNLSRSSSTTPLWPESSTSAATGAGAIEFCTPAHDDLVNFSSYHHRAYVQSLLVPEQTLQDAAGSMYGHSTIGSEKTANVFTKASKSGRGGGTAASGSDQGQRYLGSTLNTTLSTAASSSAASDYTRHATEYEFNTRDVRYSISPPSSSNQQQEHQQRLKLQTQLSPESDHRSRNILWGRPSGQRSRTPSGQTDMSGLKRPAYKSRYSSREDFLTPGVGKGGNNNANNNKLTWNSATTSYTTTSAAQPMTGASPTPSTWEYFVYPHKHIWPTIKGTYLLIARLPLRILVAVLTTLVLCFDVLLVMGAAETVLAIPMSCLLGAIAYPGAAQFDNTMNVARAMHTVNLVLIVVILPTVVAITIQHQIRMIQKYN
ncbi:hypothetical protein BG004_001537 [Podila humilis]|nr:hypothetical protein BG004_001537 [Podila humilis]